MPIAVHFTAYLDDGHLDAPATADDVRDAQDRITAAVAALWDVDTVACWNSQPGDSSYFTEREWLILARSVHMASVVAETLPSLTNSDAFVTPQDHRIILHELAERAMRNAGPLAEPLGPVIL